jgi:DNA polymerase-1
MLVTTSDQYWEVVTPLRQQLVDEADSTLIVDTETNGLDPFKYNQLCGIGISYNLETYYFPFRHQQGANLEPALLKDLVEVLGLAKKLVGYNIKFDVKFLENEGFVSPEEQTWADVIVMMRLIEPANVKDLALTSTIMRVYGEESAAYDKDTKKWLRKNKWFKDFSMAPVDVLGPYCELDALYTEKLYYHALMRIQRTYQEDVMDLENKLTRVLYGMENRGIIVDFKYASAAIKKIDLRTNLIANQIYELTDQEFNIHSTKQVGEVLNGKGVYSPLKTPKGKDAWNEAALAQIDNPIAGLIRQFRTLEKLRATYLEPYAVTETMHTSYCNWGAVTGRLSSRGPNLQNIPRTHFKLIDRELLPEERESIKSRITAQMAAKGITANLDLSDATWNTWGFVGDESYNEDDPHQLSIRRLFMARPGYTLVSFDYSQMEVRVFLSYLKNTEIEQMLRQDDIDFHGEAAKRAFSLTGEEDTFKFYRQMAKNITFGVIYGIGKAKLAKQLNVTESEAIQYKKQYFKGLPGAKEFFASVIRAIEERGWIKNRYGRVYQIEKDIAYKGVNYLVQGTSADILNERIIKVYEHLKHTQSHILLQVHDEIICEIHDNDLNYLPTEIQQLLEENTLGIPLKVDIALCTPSWATKVAPSVIHVQEQVENYIDWEEEYASSSR